MNFQSYIEYHRATNESFVRSHARPFISAYSLINRGKSKSRIDELLIFMAEVYLPLTRSKYLKRVNGNDLEMIRVVFIG